MVKKIVMECKDGDSGTFTDGTTFRLDNVNSPEKTEAGYGLGKMRAKKMMEGEVVDVETVGRDRYKRDIVKVKKRGVDVNKALEWKNRLFKVKPRK